MHLNSKIRQIWAEKTFELTNIGAGALIFGQFISERKISLILILGGVILFLIGYLASFVLLNRK